MPTLNYDSQNYCKRKARAANRDRAESAAGKEIGELPAVKSSRRRKNCEPNLLKYLLTYCREFFPLSFSNDQLDFITAIQDAVLSRSAQVSPCEIGGDTLPRCARIQPRFAFPDDEAGKLKLFKRSPTDHRMAGDHLAAEFPVKTSGRGREVFEWTKRPNAENHLLDAVSLGVLSAHR